MDNLDGSYVDDSMLTIFYQLLGVAPQVAATLYEPSMNAGVRAWLNDVYEAVPDTKTRRWLRVLYLYYGLVTGDPMSYQAIATELGCSVSVARRLAARGLRYLWFVAGVQVDLRENLRDLMRLALVANEWATCDPSDTVSFTVWVEDGEALPDAEKTRGEYVNLWDPVWADQAPPFTWEKPVDPRSSQVS